MNNKVNFLRGTSNEYESSIKDNDTFYYTTDTEKLYLGNKEITGGGVTIDDSLSDTSKNPVQNKVINAALNSKANLSDIPTSLPANGGNADTLDGKHASDFALKTNIPTTLPANGGRSDTASHQIDHILGTGTDILEYAASDNCPYNVNTKVRIMHSPTCPTNYGYDAANNDFWYDIYKLDNLWVTIKAYDIRGNVEFINSCLNGTWSGWVRCNDGGNAATANFATYSDYAGGSVQSTASNVCLRNISAGTADLSAGVSELATGAIYLVYE